MLCIIFVLGSSLMSFALHFSVSESVTGSATDMNSSKDLLSTEELRASPELWPEQSKLPC